MHAKKRKPHKMTNNIFLANNRAQRAFLRDDERVGQFLSEFSRTLSIRAACRKVNLDMRIYYRIRERAHTDPQANREAYNLVLRVEEIRMGAIDEVRDAAILAGLEPIPQAHPDRKMILAAEMPEKYGKEVRHKHDVQFHIPQAAIERAKLANQTRKSLPEPIDAEFKEIEEPEK